MNLWRGSLLPLGFVGAGEACDLLIFRSRLNRQWKDRSLASLVSSYRPSGSKLPRHWIVFQPLALCSKPQGLILDQNPTLACTKNVRGAPT